MTEKTYTDKNGDIIMDDVAWFEFYMTMGEDYFIESVSDAENKELNHQEDETDTAIRAIGGKVMIEKFMNS